MPIKTMNNNGLQVLEEVPGEYKIYIDKDAVMTTVAKYAPGSYQTFMERKADVDNSRSLLKGYKIEWTQKDDSDLFIQCNNETISKIENQPMTLDEPTQPVVLEPKTVPTTYECCFRMDKKSGEIYIGEGYENLFSSARNWANVVDVVETTGNATEGWYTAKWIGANRTDSFNPFVTNNLTVNSGDVFSFNFKCKTDCKINMVGFGGPDGQFSSDLNSITASTSTTNRHLTLRYQQIAFTQGWQETVYNICITKTSTPKPFVKSVMPSGKLAFVTEVNETTHTFLNKGDGVVTFGNGYFSLKGDKIEQFLVYNALLTEQEKQTELAKDIKLATNNTQMHVQI